MKASAELIDNLRISRPIPARPPGYKPMYVDLEKIYKTYFNGQDLRSGDLYKNECAIRMSLALSLNGFSFDRFPDKSRLKIGGRTGILVPHVYGAYELAAYLKKEWGPPISFRGKAKEIAQGIISGKRGVLYFNNCSGTGDHIDLWNGAEFYNQILGVSAHVGYSSKRNLFYKSDTIWFWEVR